MTRHTAILVFALAALSGAASADTGLAGDISVETQPFVSTRTKAEVRAELLAYKKAGVNPWSMWYNPLARFKSDKTPGEVRAEYIANRPAVSALTGEDSGSMYLADKAAAARQASRLAGDHVGEVHP